MNDSPQHNRRSSDPKTQGGVKPTTEGARTGGEAGASGAGTGARNTPSQQVGGDSMGSRAGSSLGSQSTRTGMGDRRLSDGGSSQGLTGAQGSGGGAERGMADDPDRSGQSPSDRGLPDALDRED